MMERHVRQKGYSASVGEEEQEPAGPRIISMSEQALAAVIAQALADQQAEEEIEIRKERIYRKFF